MTINHQQNTTKPILWIGFLIGAIASWGLLSGDQQGQVNILFLLLIYVAVPILSLLISCLSLIFGNGINLAKLVSVLPVWSKPIQMAFLRQKQRPHAKLVLFYQSQLAAISFSLASILVLLVLLLTTDVNFIWRSTLLSAEDVLPLLQLLAYPWGFWPAAQPELELLLVTQDSRLTNTHTDVSQLGQWWQFILAVQLIYAFLLRGVAIIMCHLILSNKQNNKNDIQLVTERRSEPLGSDQPELARVVSDTQSDFALTNWGGIEEPQLSRLLEQLSHEQVTELKAGPLANQAEQLASERWQEPQLVIVKGWEPPLGELLDYLQNGRGYLMPLDWSEQQLKPLSDHHLLEWRRFCHGLAQWQVLVPED